MSARVRIVFNRLLGGWFVVRGPHQTPLSGRFDSREQAAAYLARSTSFERTGVLK